MQYKSTINKGVCIMSTWLEDLYKTAKPEVARDWEIVGNQDRDTLRKMVKALTMFEILNTPEENERLAAAKRILKRS
jgi:hypothetical protein